MGIENLVQGSAEKLTKQAEGWPTCVICGGPIAYGPKGGRVKKCDTCRRPKNARTGYFERIAILAARAAEEKDLFPNKENNNGTKLNHC